MKGQELVSIIMLSQDNGRYVTESVRSVIAQTYQNWELIFMDDSSKDDTISQMMDLMKDKRIHVSKNIESKGSASSMNSALRDARGRWIAFLNVGDLWEPTKLERQVAFMKEHDYAVSYTKYGVIGSDGKDKGVVISGPECIDKAMMMKCYWSQLLTVMYDTEKIGKLKIPNLVVNNGYAVMLQLTEKTDCHLLSECLASQRTSKGLFVRVSLRKKFYWRYAAYRGVARLGRFEALIKTIVNLYLTIVKRVKYVEKK